MKDLFLINLLPPYEVVSLRNRKPGWRSQLCQNPRFELCLVTKGSLKVVLQNKEYTLRTSDMYLVPASDPHISYTETGFSQMAINFRIQEDERGLITMLKKSAKSISIWHQCQLLQAAAEFMEMGDLLTLQDQLYAAQRLDAIVLSFMKWKDHSSVFQQQLRSLLENHLATPLTLQEIAEEMSYSRAQVQRVTQQQLGCSVMEFYRRIRLQKACEWLLYSDLHVGWIAESLGFSDQSHFQSFFKDRMHMTPKQFRLTKRM